MRVSVVAVLVVLVAACGSDKSPTGPANTNTAFDVYTVSEAFSPSFLQITLGDTVRFNIVLAPDGDGHDVTFDAKPGAPANIPVTKTGVVSRVFKTRGTFHYNCFVHPGMAGDVQVQ